MVQDVSVVIPAYNEADIIGRTLDSLRGQDAEVVVVAGGDDGTDAVAAAHPVVDMVVEDSSGLGAARNTGAYAATGDILLLTDADTVVGPHWVERHRRHFADPDVIATGGPVYALDTPETTFRDRLLFKLHFDVWFRLVWPLGFLHQDGANSGIRMSAFEHVGGHDEDIHFMQDIELSLRLRHHGRAVYDPSCWVRSSPRRQHEQGYLGVLSADIRGLASHYLLGASTDTGYFDHVTGDD